MKQGDMKQINKNSPDINLDALELEIAAAAKSTKASADPLAELARIMGQDDPFAGLGKTASQMRSPASAGRSLDDILNAPPSSILRSDHREANFDAGLDQPAFRTSVAPLDEALEDQDEPEASLEQAAVDQNDQDKEDQIEDDLFERDDLTGAADIDALEKEMAQAREKLFAEEKAYLPEVPTKTTAGSPQFDDMLAEFESAMRDVGGEKIANVSAPSLEPVTLPPPPADLLYAQETSTGYDNSGLAGAGLAGAAAAGAAIIASGAQASNNGAQYVDEAAPKVKKPRRGLMIAGGVIGVAVIGISALFAFGSGPKKSINGAAPVIAAKTGVTKERPANPGGVDVPNQDKEVFRAPSTAPTAAERVAPREEQPVDLRQAQNTTPVVPVVRQIPGAGPVVAAPTTASPSVAGAQPVPRPVASVPIAIAGAPAPAAAAPAVPAPAPAVPAPVVAAPTAPTAPAPTAPAVAAARPVAEAEAPAAPRRVRAVPIKTDAEAAPRPQPRPVQAARPAPAAPEPDAANAPLRITPQAVRNSQRVASAEPTEPAASRPATTSSAGGSGGFTVQLGAEGSQESARAKFNKMKSDHSDVLGSQNANIRNAEVNGRSVYRIRVGNMSREQAVGMCERLKADGGSCFVARN
jgi:hypothetical protein